MAECATDKPLGGGTPGKTIDALSKEDLIKFAKKQAVNISQMKAKIVDLQKSKEALTREKEGLRNDVVSAKDKSSSLQEENDCLNQKLQTVTASYLAIADEADEAGAACHVECERERKKLKADNQKLEDLLSDVSLSLDEVEREKQNLSQTLRNSKASLEELQAQNVDLKSSVQRTLDDGKVIAELRSELRAKSEEMATLKDSLDRLDVLKCNLDDEVSKWRKSFDECQLSIRDVNDEKDALADEKEKAIGEVTRLKREMDELKNEKSNVEEREVKLKTMAQKMKAELLRRREEDKNRSVNEGRSDQSTSSEPDVDAKISSLERDLKAQKDLSQSAVESFEAKKEENERLISEAATLRDNFDESLEEASRLKASEASFASTIGTLRAELARVGASNLSLSEESEELRKIVEGQRLRADESEKKMDETFEETEDLRNAKLLLEDEKLRLREEIRDKTRSLEEISANEELRLKRVDELNAEANELRGRLEEKDASLTRETMENARLVGRIATLEMAEARIESESVLSALVDGVDLEKRRVENEKLIEETERLGGKLRQSSEAAAENGARIEDLSSKVVELRALLEEKSSLVASLEKDISAKVEAETRIENLSTKVDELEVLLEQKSSAIASLEKNSSVKTEEESLIENLNIKVNELEVLLEQKSSVIANLEKGGPIIMEGEAPIEDLSTKVSELEELLERKNIEENSSEEAKRRVEILGLKVSELEILLEQKSSLIESLEENISEAEAEAKVQIGNLNAKVKEAEALLDQKSSSIASLEEKSRAEAEAAKTTKAEIEELHRGVDERDEKLDLIESEVQELQRENSSLETAAMEWTATRQRLETRLAEKEKDDAATIEERERFKATIIVKEEKLRLMEEERSSKEAELNATVHKMEEEAKVTSGKLSASVKSLEEEKTRHKQTYAKLENLKKNAQKKSVMHLEISDYEKTVDQLTRTIEERDKEKVELREEIRHRDEKIDALTSEKANVEIQREEESQRAEMIKTNLDKVKAELELARDADHAHQMREIGNERRMESLRTEVEEAKISLADAAANAKRNEDDLSRKLEGEQRALKALQSKYELVEDELQHAQMEIVAVKEEMSNYKTKAQAVLKQAKAESRSKESSKLAKAELERMGSRVKELEAEVEALQNEIRETIDESDGVKADREESRRAHADVLRQLNAAEERHRAAAKEWERENKTCKDNYESSLQSLTERQDSLVESHRNKLTTAQRESANQLAVVQRVADSNEQEVFRLQKELQIALAISSTDLQQQQHGVAPHPNGGSGFPPPPLLMTSSAVVDGEGGGLLRGAAFISSIERQEGEGMEHTDTSECGSPVPSQPFVSFDQLLSSPNMSTIDSVTTTPLPSQKHVWPTEEVTLKTLHEELSTASRKVAHLTELLRESEASNARLAEESKILKEEIRRTERNSHRQMELDNLEYLKNVIFKFLSFESDAEARGRLVPVLTMLLKLSPEEKQMLMSMAAGEGPAAGAPMQANAPEGGGWSTYLHRWSGLM